MEIVRAYNAKTLILFALGALLTACGQQTRTVVYKQSELWTQTQAVQMTKHPIDYSSCKITYTPSPELTPAEYQQALVDDHSAGLRYGACISRAIDHRMTQVGVKRGTLQTENWYRQEWQRQSNAADTIRKNAERQMLAKIAQVKLDEKHRLQRKEAVEREALAEKERIAMGNVTEYKPNRTPVRNSQDSAREKSTAPSGKIIQKHRAIDQMEQICREIDHHPMVIEAVKLWTPCHIEWTVQACRPLMTELDKPQYQRAEEQRQRIQAIAKPWDFSAAEFDMIHACRDELTSGLFFRDVEDKFIRDGNPTFKGVPLGR